MFKLVQMKEMVWISFFSKENFQTCRMKTGMRGHSSYVMNKVRSQTNEGKWEHLNNGFSRKQEIVPQSCALHLLPAWLQLCGALMSKSREVIKAWFHLAPIKVVFTVVTKHKEAAGAEVTVEFDENLIGGGGHALLDGVAAELADLGWSLVGSVPEELKKVGIWKTGLCLKPQVIT